MDLIRDFFGGRQGKAGAVPALDAVDASALNPMSELQVLEHHEDIVRCLCRVGPPGSPLIASAGDDGTVIVWDSNIGKRVAVLREHSLPVNDLLCLASTQLASASTDKSIRIWNTSTFQCEHVLRAHQGSVKCLAALPDGKFASGGNDRTLCVWNSGTGEAVSMIARPEEEILHCLLALPNGRLITGSNSPKIMVYNAAKGKHECELGGHRESVRCLAALQNGTMFASASLDGAIVIWNGETLSQLRTLNFQEKIRNEAKAYQWCVRRLVPLGDKYLAATISTSLVVYDAMSGAIIFQVRNAHEAELVDIAPLYDGACLITCAADASIRLWSNRQAFNFLLDRVQDSDTLQPTAAPGGPPLASRPLSSLLKKVGLNRLEPIYFGEMLAHSYSVNRLLPLSATSVASCGSDGLVVLWKDGRHQSALRSRIAAMHLAAQQVHDDSGSVDDDEERWP